MDKLKIIKGAVFVMTLLLFVGLTALMIGLMTGKSKKAETVAVASFVAEKQLSFTDSPNEIWLGEGNGSEIKDFKTCGENLCILIAEGGEDDRIFVLSPQGKIIQKIHTGEEPFAEEKSEEDTKTEE